MQELPLDPANAGPFTQPFLTLTFVDGTRWHIDVGGNLDPYIVGYSRILKIYESLTEDEKSQKGVDSLFSEGVNWLSRATPLLLKMIDDLARINPCYTVSSVYSYTGTAGPGFILRQGAFFKRFDLSPKVPHPIPIRIGDRDVNEYLLRLGFLSFQDKQ